MIHDDLIIQISIDLDVMHDTYEHYSVKHVKSLVLFSDVNQLPNQQLYQVINWFYQIFC